MRRIRHDRFVGVTLKTGLKSGTSDVCRIDRYSMLDSTYRQLSVWQRWSRRGSTLATRLFAGKLVLEQLLTDCRVLVVFIHVGFCAIAAAFANKLINLSRQQIHLIEYVRSGQKCHFRWRLVYFLECFSQRCSRSDSDSESDCE